MKVLHHLMIGDSPFCDWLGCKAGQDIALKSGVHLCGHNSGASAKRDAKALQPFFKAKVRAVRGACPKAL